MAGKRGVCITMDAIKNSRSCGSHVLELRRVHPLSMKPLPLAASCHPGEGGDRVRVRERGTRQTQMDGSNFKQKAGPQVSHPTRGFTLDWEEEEEVASIRPTSPDPACHASHAADRKPQTTQA